MRSWAAVRAAIVLVASAASETTPAALRAQLTPLNAALARENKRVVECGAGGACGPNSLAAVLGDAGLHDGDGEALRERVVNHATRLLRSRAVWCDVQRLSVREVIEDSFASWALPGRSVNRVGGLMEWEGPRQVLTAESWLKFMARPTTWIDQAFLSLAADCFAVDIQLHTVAANGGGESGLQRMEPRGEVDVLAQVELAYVVDQHFCAILPTEQDRT